MTIVFAQIAGRKHSNLQAFVEEQLEVLPPETKTTYFRYITTMIMIIRKIYVAHFPHGYDIRKCSTRWSESGPDLNASDPVSNPRLHCRNTVYKMPC